MRGGVFARTLTQNHICWVLLRSTQPTCFTFDIRLKVLDERWGESLRFEYHKTIDIIEITITSSNGRDPVTSDESNVNGVVWKQIMAFHHVIRCRQDDVADGENLKDSKQCLWFLEIDFFDNSTVLLNVIQNLFWSYFLIRYDPKSKIEKLCFRNDHRRSECLYTPFLGTP